MIEKKINYIWLSGKRYSSLERRCLHTWKKFLPDYTLIKWDKDKIRRAANNAGLKNPLDVTFVAEAIKYNKWAFATDYLRQWVIYNFGGYYFDMDIAVNERLKPKLEQANKFDFVSSIEFHEIEYYHLKQERENNPNAEPIEHVPGLCIQAALCGGAKHNSLSKAILQYYDTQHYVLEDGSFFEFMVAPDIYALQAKKFGFKYHTEKQVINADNEKFIIFDKNFCAPAIYYVNNNNCAFHLCENSWKKVTAKERLLRRLRLNKLYRQYKGQCKIF